MPVSLAAFAPGGRDLGINLFRSQSIKPLFLRIPLDSPKPFGSRWKLDRTDADLLFLGYRVAKQSFDGQPIDPARGL